MVIPLSQAALRRGRALSSFKTHFCQVSEPYDMHPKTVPLVDDHCGEREEGQITHAGDFEARFAKTDVFHLR